MFNLLILSATFISGTGENDKLVFQKVVYSARNSESPTVMCNIYQDRIYIVRDSHVSIDGKNSSLQNTETRTFQFVDLLAISNILESLSKGKVEKIKNEVEFVEMTTYSASQANGKTVLLKEMLATDTTAINRAAETSQVIKMIDSICK